MSIKVTPGWKFHHIGFEGDGVSHKGVDLWKSADNWESLKNTIVAANPSYPDQRHNLSVYKIKDQDVTFATGEVSNGVWVFCIPT